MVRKYYVGTRVKHPLKVINVWTESKTVAFCWVLIHTSAPVRQFVTWPLLPSFQICKQIVAIFQMIKFTGGEICFVNKKFVCQLLYWCKNIYWLVGVGMASGKCVAIYHYLWVCIAIGITNKNLYGNKMQLEKLKQLENLRKHHHPSSDFWLTCRYSSGNCWTFPECIGTIESISRYLSRDSYIAVYKIYCTPRGLMNRKL